jgi:predicted Zn-ribbon and HTH transcriptional regulator
MSGRTQDATSEERPTTTCARCGNEYRDRDMMPNPQGAGEVCCYCLDALRLDPANCRECGTPFNDAEPSPSGCCPACE